MKVGDKVQTDPLEINSCRFHRFTMNAVRVRVCMQIDTAPGSMVKREGQLPATA